MHRQPPLAIPTRCGLVVAAARPLPTPARWPTARPRVLGAGDFAETARPGLRSKSRADAGLYGRHQAGREGSWDGHDGATVGSGRGEDVRGGGGARRSWGKVMAAWFPCHARTYGVINVVTP